MSRLQHGEPAPDISALSWDGKQIDLRELLRLGPVVIFFLRSFG